MGERHAVADKPQGGSTQWQGVFTKWCWTPPGTPG